MLFREYLIHHEDVRRANGMGARTDVPELQDAAWNKVPSFGKRMLVAADPFGIELVTPDGRSHVVKKGDRRVRIVGEPIELFLYVFGRTTVANVEILENADQLRVRDTSKLQALPRIDAGVA
jgi:hypothetical protein